MELKRSEAFLKPVLVRNMKLKVVQIMCYFLAIFVYVLVALFVYVLAICFLFRVLKQGENIWYDKIYKNKSASSFIP